ncbi:MAG TPA: SCO family protein [Opitutaceae bacterium]|nr:SCO family protein [Opitutaceae bacterium]
MKTALILAIAALYSQNSYADQSHDATAPDDCCKVTAAAAPLPGKSIYQLGSEWTDDNGRTFELGSLRGKHVLVGMFFTSCQFACPVLVHDMKTFQANLSPAERAKTELVLISFDSARDNVEALHAFRKTNELDEHWHIVRGQSDDVAETAAVLGVRYKQDAKGDFMHSNLITFLNADGVVDVQKSGNQIVRE